MNLPNLIIYGKSGNEYRLYGVLMVSFGFSVNTIHIHLNMECSNEEPFAIKNDEEEIIPLKKNACITLNTDDIKQIITHHLK